MKCSDSVQHIFVHEIYATGTEILSTELTGYTHESQCFARGYCSLNLMLLNTAMIIVLHAVFME